MLGDTGGRRWRGIAGRGLLITGTAILAATAALLAVTAARHLSQPLTPVLPVSWCRSAGGALLPPLTGLRWLTSWQFDAVATVVLAAVAAVYLAGVVSVSRRRRPWPLWRTLSFLAGLGVCLLAVSSSIGVYDMALFTTHMLGHLALVMVAPPLLVLGRPLILALHAVGNPWHTRIKRVLRSPPVALWFSPPVALASYTVVIVGTHLTGLMDVIMQRPWAGQVEHLAYVLIGFQFFAVALGDEPLRWNPSPPGKEVLLALAMGVDTLTGVVLFQSDQAIAMEGVAGGVDPLAQTQTGGAIMWVAGDGLMIVVMLVVALLWLHRPDLRRRAGQGWMGAARRGTLATLTAPPGAPAAAPGARPTTTDVDADDQSLADYNAWLARMARHQP